MVFNRRARIETGRVQRRGRGAGAGGMVVGGGAGTLILLLIALFFGVDLTGLSGSNLSVPSVYEDPEVQAEFDQRCVTGEDANRYDDCRLAFAVAALDSYWESAAPALGIDFNHPGAVIFDGSTSTQCGQGSSETGPFYCPVDETMYFDPTFFEVLSARFGAGEGPLAQIYVVAHEYGHHIQNEMGLFEIADRSRTGPDSDIVKLELAADCLAGVWLHHATRTVDDSGTPFLNPISEEQIHDALEAAAAVGDDNIQRSIGQNPDPHTFTHGSSEQRVNAVVTGINQGDARVCDAFGLIGGESSF